MMEVEYVCKSNDLSCPYSCEGLANCIECGCAMMEGEGGPGGPAIDVILCLLPIIFLLVVTLKSNPLPTTASLPLSALILLLVRLMYLGSDPVLCFGSVILGLHEALSPLSIMFGAMLLFETMENTLCMPFMLREMKDLTNGHTVAELMIIYSFAYMVEGASGFGTPAALGAPMLASLGYPKLIAVVTLLCMNTFGTVWGAVGTPIWFGFGNLGLSHGEFVEISYKAGTCLLFGAYLILPTLVLTKACPFSVLRNNWIFLLLSISSVMLPTFGLSFVSYEFPALLGGMIGCLLNSLLIKFKIGLREISDADIQKSGRSGRFAISSTSVNSVIDSYRSMKASQQMQSDTNKIDQNDVEGSNKVPIESANGTSSSLVKNSKYNPNGSNIEKLEFLSEEEDEGLKAIEYFIGERKTGISFVKEVIGRTFPIWGVVLLLILTRVPAIGLKSILTAKDPGFQIYFGTYGEFRCSASLVLQLNNILTYPGLNWKYELLYVPFFMPFVIISVITMVLYRHNLQMKPREIFNSVAKRLINPSKALFGALIMVQLLIKTGPSSPSSIIGNNLANAFKEGWIAIASFIGALGSFFSGSTTISDLTFGGVQKLAAEFIGTSVTSMLGLQVAGASAGNGICLNNIIAACAVVGLNIGEGAIISKTAAPVAAFCVLSMVVMLTFYFRF